MINLKDYLIKFIFGNKNSKQISDHIKIALNKYIYIPHIQNETVTSIFFFIGKWLPFSIATGITMGVITSIIDFFVVHLNHILSTNVIFLFIYPLLVSIIAGKAMKQTPKVAGPGIGFSILHLYDKKYISLKAIKNKFVLAVFTLSGGFIAGREGPAFFLGVSLAEWMGRAYGFSRKFKKMLGLIGGGAFTGAILKAPLGSSIFAMELENTYDLNYRPFVPMIIASIVSYLTLSFFRGNNVFIQLTGKAIWTINSIPYIILLGVAISIVMYIYSTLFHFIRDIGKIMLIDKKPLVGTLIATPFMIILYHLTNADILSAPANMNILSHLVTMDFSINMDISIVIFTIIITSFTLGFGIPGGLVLPVLIIGAALGNIFGHIFPNQLITFTLAGMSAALAASAKTPLAAIVMITEMTHDNVVIPMTAAVITSYLTSFGYSLYLGQKNIFKSNLKDFKSYRVDTDKKPII